eukprot:123783-Prymnesium_polylepis.1
MPDAVNGRSAARCRNMIVRECAAFFTYLTWAAARRHRIAHADRRGWVGVMVDRARSSRWSLKNEEQGKHNSAVAS